MHGTYIVYWADDVPAKVGGWTLDQTPNGWPGTHPQDLAAIKALKPGETFVDSETDPETGIPLVLVHRIS